MSGSRVHQSERVDDYGESFGPGDVIGCAIYLLPPTIPQAVGGEATRRLKVMGLAAQAVLTVRTVRTV